MQEIIPHRELLPEPVDEGRRCVIRGEDARTCSRSLCEGYARNALQVIGDLNLLPSSK